MDPTARENTFGLLGPSGTVIATDHPNLRWQALAGATSYTVSVFDADFNRVTRSAPQTATQWTVADTSTRDDLFVGSSGRQERARGEVAGCSRTQGPIQDIGSREAARVNEPEKA